MKLLPSLRTPSLKGFLQNKNWHSLLLHKAIVLNLSWIFLFIILWSHGIITLALTSDSVGIIYGSIIIFIYGLFMSWFHIFKISTQLNMVKAGKNVNRLYELQTLINNNNKHCSVEQVNDAVKLKLWSKITFIRHISTTLVMLGLLGTVVGFIISLQSLTTDIIQDISALSKVMVGLTQGMGIALYTTAVGTVLSLWITMNYNILLSATNNLIAELIVRLKISKKYF